MHVEHGEVVGLLGPNGAGKTTTFYMVVGLVRPDQGTVLLDGKDITKMPMYQRARNGIGYLPQEPSVFRKLTVAENLMAILETMDLSGLNARNDETACWPSWESRTWPKIWPILFQEGSGGE